MSVCIDREDLFKNYLLFGINLFTGAGFSCLPDDSGKTLPVATDLCKEICINFELEQDIYGDDLETVSTIVDGSEFQDFLRRKFTVDKINSKYLLLNRIAMLSYITTNIDNIVHLAIEQGTRYYLKSITYYGATRSGSAELSLIPLHGEVMNLESPLFFGKFDLATADQSNSDLFQLATTKLRKTPTLFWGYGFHDSGVLKIVKKLLESGTQDIWIQCRQTDKRQIDMFRRLGCNIIIAETDELFDWIETNIPEKVEEQNAESIVQDEKLKRYFIPTIGQVPAVQAKDYYVKGITQWYSVLAKQAIELDIVNDVYNSCLTNKNTIVIGTSFSGKSTLLMQLALKLDAANKLFVSNLTPEESEFIVKSLNGISTIVFIDNCETNILAYRILAQTESIKTVATATDYAFEGSKHLLEQVTYKTLFIPDLSKNQAQRFYDLIDGSLRNGTFSYKENEQEKFSILEMMLKNITNSMGKRRVENMLIKMKKENKPAFNTVALAIYLTSNNSSLSNDIIFSYFDCSTFQDVQKYVNDANGLLRELNITMDHCDDDQDYYDVRSRLFLYHAKSVLSENAELKTAYANTIATFLQKVSRYKIYRYNEFKRSAFDAKLFYSLFGKDANAIYNDLYDYDSNPYTLQQWALCRAYLNEFKEAFAAIDKAQRQKPSNFSIRNSSAIILFEANKHDTSEIGRAKRTDAMNILKECYSNDKRKSYHANKFAEFAIEISKIDSNYEYIEQALIWLGEIVCKDEGTSRYTRHNLAELNKIRKA